MVTESTRKWVLLVYRLPREPSAPRLALWRSLRRFGAVLLGDGLAALPADERTIEHAEWLAAGIEENGGVAAVWLATPRQRQTAERLAAQATAAVEAEYVGVISESAAIRGEPAQAGVAQRRLRRRLREVGARDYFGAPSRDAARTAVEVLTAARQPA